MGEVRAQRRAHEEPQPHGPARVDPVDAARNEHGPVQSGQKAQRRVVGVGALLRAGELLVLVEPLQHGLLLAPHLLAPLLDVGGLRRDLRDGVPADVDVHLPRGLPLDDAQLAHHRPVQVPDRDVVDGVDAAARPDDLQAVVQPRRPGVQHVVPQRQAVLLRPPVAGRLRPGVQVGALREQEEVVRVLRDRAVQRQEPVEDGLVGLELAGDVGEGGELADPAEAVRLLERPLQDDLDLGQAPVLRQEAPVVQPVEVRPVVDEAD